MRSYGYFSETSQGQRYPETGATGLHFFLFEQLAYLYINKPESSPSITRTLPVQDL